MFLAHTHVQPKEVGTVEFQPQKSGRTIVTFTTPAHASLAFKTLDGEEKADPTGKLQKRVYMNSGSYIQVRQMIQSKNAPKSDPKRDPKRRRSR